MSLLQIGHMPLYSIKHLWINRRTSIRVSQWSGTRGNMEGLQYGNKENYFHPELRDWTHLPNVTRILLERGYSDEAIRKVLGENFLRVYKKVI